jgi:hypothetical protein
MTKPIQRLLHIVKRFQYVLHAVFVLRMRRGHAIEPGLLLSRKCYESRNALENGAGESCSRRHKRPERSYRRRNSRILLGRTRSDLILIEVMRNLCNKSREFILI